MPVRVPPFTFVGESSDLQRLQPSTRPPDQNKWLKEKYALYEQHHDNKTLGQFFPPLYEEYFARWPPTPTEEAIEAAKGNAVAAAARTRKTEQDVRDLPYPTDLRSNHGGDQRIYRWMFNQTRSKRGVNGEGSSASLNLTAGAPRKKTAVQVYVKRFWAAKIKQEVINRWAPTPETDLFDEADIGEDQTAWEELTPMEKNVPLWFRMAIGRELYETESDEVKAEIDQLRDKEKEEAVVAQTSPTTFTTEEERLKLMNKFDK